MKGGSTILLEQCQLCRTQIGKITKFIQFSINKKILILYNMEPVATM